MLAGGSLIHLLRITHSLPRVALLIDLMVFWKDILDDLLCVLDLTISELDGLVLSKVVLEAVWRDWAYHCVHLLKILVVTVIPRQLNHHLHLAK